MIENFTETDHCTQKVHCRTCRTNEDWRFAMTGKKKFKCPHGVTKKDVIEYPDKYTMAVSAIDAAAQVMEQPELASTEVIEQRTKICKGCPEFVVDDNRCEKCGCNLPLKRTFKTFECPEGKW